MQNELEKLMLELQSAFYDSGRSDYRILMMVARTSHEETLLVIALRYHNFCTTKLLIKHLQLVIHI